MRDITDIPEKYQGDKTLYITYLKGCYLTRWVFPEDTEQMKNSLAEDVLKMGISPVFRFVGVNSEFGERCNIASEALSHGLIQLEDLERLVLTGQVPPEFKIKKYGRKALSSHVRGVMEDFKKLYT